MVRVEALLEIFNRNAVARRKNAPWTTAAKNRLLVVRLWN